MKSLNFIIALAISYSLSAQNVKGSIRVQKDTITEFIVKTEQARVKSLVDRNMVLANELHAEDFQLITPTGNTLTKEQYLGMISTGYLKYNWEPGDITVKLSGNTAIIRYTDKIFQVSVNGNLVNDGKFTHTDLYERRNGKWQIVWSQASGQNAGFLTMQGVTFVKKDYTVANTQQYDFGSVINGKSYRLFVALPPNYGLPNDTTRYDVLYVLDGNDQWPLVVAGHHVLRRALGGLNNPAGGDFIIVGIGYPVQANWNIMPYRASDYTPTQNAMEDSVLIKPFGIALQTGGALKFLQVLKNEIIPFIDQNFRATKDRGIIGHSLGAGFVTYSLFQEPELFTRYAILSPNFFRDNNFLINQESLFAKNHTELNKTVFIARGSDETNSINNSTPQMVALLNKHYKELNLHYVVFADETHFSVLPAEISRSLQLLGYDPSAAGGK